MAGHWPDFEKKWTGVLSDEAMAAGKRIINGYQVRTPVLLPLSASHYAHMRACMRVRVWPLHMHSMRNSL